MDNVTIAKYLLVLVTAPLWWPVLRALWVEANRMLVEDGGLLGRPPTAKEIGERRRALEELEDPLVHEPLLGEDARRAAVGRGAGRPSDARPGTAAHALRPGPRRPGFR